jgi:hypothetical protein
MFHILVKLQNCSLRKRSCREKSGKKDRTASFLTQFCKFASRGMTLANID